MRPEADVSGVCLRLFIILNKNALQDVRAQIRKFYRFAVLRRCAKWEFPLKIEGAWALKWACPFCFIKSGMR